MQQAIEEAKKIENAFAFSVETCLCCANNKALIERLESLKDDHLPQDDGWISVEDRLPKHEKNVLAYDGRNYFLAWYSFEYKVWSSSLNLKMVSVIYWRPSTLPCRINEDDKNHLYFNRI